MTLFRRILPFLSTLSLFAVLEFVFNNQRFFWYALPLLVVLTILPIGILLSWKLRDREFWHVLVTPVSLVFSSIFLLLFLSDRSVSHVLILSASLLYGWYAENVFLFHFRPELYQAYALEHISLYLNLLAVFFFFSSLYAARVFLSISMPLMLVLGALVIFFFAIQLVWSAKIPWERGWSIVMVVSLILMEFFGVVSILPTTFFVAGFLLAIPYYLVMNVTRHALRDTLSRKVIVRNLVIGSIALLVTLTTAPWT